LRSGRRKGRANWPHKLTDRPTNQPNAPTNSEIRGGNPAPQIEWMLDNRSLSKEVSVCVTLARLVAPALGGLDRSLGARRSGAQAGRVEPASLGSQS